MSNRRSGSGKEIILPLLAIGMSLLEVVQFLFDPSNIPALIVSLLGITAGCLWFAGHRLSMALLRIWIIAQLPAIRQLKVVEIPNGKQYLNSAVLDTGQGLTFNVGLELNRPDGGLEVKVNLVPIGLLFLFSFLRTASLIGSRVVIARFRKDNKLGDVFPLEGIVLRSAKLGAEEHWLLLELDKEVRYRGDLFKCLLVRDKEGERSTNLARPGVYRIWSSFRIRC